MGLPGRPPKPDSALRPDYAKKHPGLAARRGTAIRYPRHDGTPPERLTDRAKVHYARYFALLDAQGEEGLCTEADVDLLAALSNTLVDIEDCEQILKADGWTLMDDDGVTKKHPLGPQLVQLRSMQIKLTEQLGLTPLARQRVRLPEDSGPVTGDNIVTFDNV
jgi:P27 family predicted phage terminase small subunit